MYPRLLIDKEKFRHNVKELLNKCHQNGQTMMAVSKVFCADHELINVLIDEGVDYIADSRIQNLMTFTAPMPRVLLRLPMISEAELVVKHSEISLNSELETIKALNKESAKSNTKHGIILMIDLGDLREGIFIEEDIYSIVEKTLKLEHIELKGIGTNLTCYGGVIPSVETLTKLVEYKNEIEAKFDITLEIISGGNSSNIELLTEGLIPFGINNIRLGESIALGRETAYGNEIENLYNDVFTLEAEIIELKEKPSIPIGEIGMNAFGKTPIFKDKGNMLRAIIGIGKQDVDYQELIPFDTLEAIGSSSDHIILDMSQTYNIYNVGEPVLFRLTYSSVLSLTTSKYVKRIYV